MRENQEGLTDTYNRFHNAELSDDKIGHLRELHVEMDEAVSAAYGWTDIDLGHGFYETDKGTRFTISEAAKTEILQRLLELNHEKYGEELSAIENTGGRKKKTPTAGKKKSIPSKPDFSLFDSLDSTASFTGEATEAVLSCLKAAEDWLAKDEVVSRSGIPTSQWQSTINQLLADGLVERQGERRGAKYRAVKRNR